MAFLEIAATIFASLVTTLVFIFIRLKDVLSRNRPKPPRRRRGDKTHLLIVLGSGGHTAEMLGMLERALQEHDSMRRLEWEDYAYRTWVVGTGDAISAVRAKEFEEMAFNAQGRESGSGDGDSYRIVTVPRAREIHQSAWTAPLSCFRCMVACRRILLPGSEGKGEDSMTFDSPDLILTSGPATATILAFTSVLLRFFDVGKCNARGKMRTVYVESWARVKKLSLSGKLMVWVVDRFFVQWPQLLDKTRGNGEYIGVLV